jgi:hypothetical protein
LLFVFALAISSLMVSAPVAAAPAAHSAEIEFDLAANNGLHAHVATFNEVNLEIARKGRSVTYEVEGESTEAGLKARFGKLGVIDVAFRPTKTLNVEQPPKGCKGDPSISREGLFIGTIEFTGEREYVRIESAQAKGRLSVYRESEWQCPRHRGPAHPHPQRRSAFSSRQRSGAKREPASLLAINRRCVCFFGAFAVGDRGGRGRSVFLGAKFEEREGMEISRVTSASAGASAFSFDHAAGTARVLPPQPFSGGGAFKRRPHSRDLWRSTIRVPLLGADPLTVRAPGYRAKLVRALPGE